MGYEGSIYPRTLSISVNGERMLCVDNVSHLRFASRRPLPKF